MKLSERMLERLDEDELYQDKKPVVKKFKDNRKEITSPKKGDFLRSKSMKRHKNDS